METSLSIDYPFQMLANRDERMEMYWPRRDFNRLMIDSSSPGRFDQIRMRKLG